VLLAAGVNIIIGLILLVIPHWTAAWSRFALYWTVAALAAFFPWVTNMPLLPSYDGRAYPLIPGGPHPERGVFAAFAGLLVALVGTLLQQERLPTQERPEAAHLQVWRAKRDRTFSRMVTWGALALAVVFIVSMLPGARVISDSELLRDMLYI